MGEALRTAVGSGGSQAAAGLAGLAGRHRTRSRLLHLALATIESPGDSELMSSSMERRNLPVLANDNQPGGLAAASGQPRCAFGSSAERLTARKVRPPWLLKNKGGITAGKEEQKIKNVKGRMLRSGAMRQDSPLARRIRSRGLLERKRAELPPSDVDTKHVRHSSPPGPREQPHIPTCNQWSTALSIMREAEVQAVRFFELPWSHHQ